MQFTVTGPKAFPVESELTIDDLITKPLIHLAYKQMRRVTHAISHRYLKSDFPWEAVIEIHGIFAN